MMHAMTTRADAVHDTTRSHTGTRALAVFTILTAMTTEMVEVNQMMVTVAIVVMVILMI